MPRLTKYPSILTEQYYRIINATDVRGFFTHLYIYLQIIHTDDVLLELINRAVSEEHAALYPEDAVNMPDFTNGNQPPQLLVSMWFTRSLKSDKGQVQLFYCWLRLFLFYNFRKHPFEVRNSYSTNPQYKFNVLLLKNEFANIFNKNTEENNRVIKLDQYKLCIEVLHPWLKRYIEEKTEAESEEDVDNYIPLTQPRKEKEYATFSFHGLATPVVEYRGNRYTFDPLDDKFDPWKIVSYCWTYMLDKEVSIDDLREDAQVSAPGGIKEALRKSPLFIKSKNKRGALTPFLSGVSSKFITVRSRVTLSAAELETIELTANKSEEI